MSQVQIGAIDIGGTKIASALVTFSDSSQQASVKVSYREAVPTLAKEGGEQVLARVIASAQRLQSLCPGLTWLGIGSAGVIASGSGRVLSATDIMPGWAGQPLRAAVEEATGLQVRVLNDVCAHVLSEAVFGAGQGYQEVLGVAAGTGLGGALILSGQLYAGARGVAGHLGHVPHPDALGLPCSCGTRRGHVEAIASGYGVAQLYGQLLTESERANSDFSGCQPAEQVKDFEAGQEDGFEAGQVMAGAAGTVKADETMKPGTLSVQSALDAYQIQLLAEQGDKLARRAYFLSGRAMGETLAGLANALDPQVIVISGSLAKAGDLWLKPLEAGYQDGALPLLKQVPLKLSAGLDDTALLGAAHFARQDWLS